MHSLTLYKLFPISYSSSRTELEQFEYENVSNSLFGSSCLKTKNIDQICQTKDGMSIKLS